MSMEHGACVGGLCIHPHTNNFVFVTSYSTLYLATGWCTFCLGYSLGTGTYAEASVVLTGAQIICNITVVLSNAVVYNCFQMQFQMLDLLFKALCVLGGGYLKDYVFTHERTYF